MPTNRLNLVPRRSGKRGASARLFAQAVTPGAAGSEVEADVAIVGSGVAGALIGWKLAEAGLRVTILEAGPRVDRDASVNRYRATIAQTPDSPYDKPAWAPYPIVLSLKDGYYVQTGPELFGSTYLRAVGGTTWHWLGSMIRLLPDDFAMRSRYGVGEDWPLSYDELEPWYLEGEAQLGTAGDNAFDLGSPRSAGYPLPGIPQTYSDTLVTRASETLGWRVEPTPQARNSVQYQDRPPCCGNAMCIPICPIAAKYDASVHVALAERAGARVVENAVVDRVEVDPEGRVAGLRYKTPDGADRVVTARVYVVAANAIETAKLLLISRSEALPNGVANSSGAVGRYLADHPVKLSIAAANDPLYPYRAPLSTSGIEQLRGGDFRGERSGFRLEIGNDGWSWPGFDPLGVAQELIEQGVSGDELYRTVHERIPYQMRVASLTEQLPNPDHRVVPHPTEMDELGIPRPELIYNVDGYTRAGLAAAEQAHDQLFDALGVSFRQHFPGFFGAGHLMGTHRMGADPRASVTDPDGRTHDHPNLWLAGAGLFPTTGTANPTATVAALSLRTAAAIAAEFGRVAATPGASPLTAATPLATPVDLSPATPVASAVSSMS